MPNRKRPFDIWSSEATAFAVWIVSRWITKQIAVPSLRRVVTAAAALNVTNGSITSKYSLVSAAAAVTTRLKLGTAICLVIQRDTIQTAKAVASLDQISKGRFLFGIGCGW